MVFARETGQQTLTFGVSGKLIMNALVMYDHQTDTLWSQFLSRAVEGPLQGTRLELLSALQTDWGTWVDLHPDTLALDKGGRFTTDPYEDYYLAKDAGVLGESRKDDRLHTKEFVIGLEEDGMARAYPFSALNESPVVNDTFQGTPILVVFNANSATGVVFERTVRGRTLTFDPVEEPTGELSQMVDEETGTLWQALTGKAVEGPLAGTTLEQVPSTYSFWFGWKDFFPHTEVFGR